MSINVTILCLALAAVAFDYFANRDDLNDYPQYSANSEVAQQKEMDSLPEIEIAPRGVVLGAVYGRPMSKLYFFKKPH